MPDSTNALHLAFGLGEDWNDASGISRAVQGAGLHLAFGLGEDWNTRSIPVVKLRSSLHLAFGLGEDWNKL